VAGGRARSTQTIAAGAALVTFSGDKLLAGPQAGIIAGDRALVDACIAHPLARALRPGGLVLVALQSVALTYLDRTAASTIPFWSMATAPRRRSRGDAPPGIGAARPGAEVVELQSLPGAGSAPGATIPSFGVALEGDHLRDLRAATPPIIARSREGRTFLDLRSVAPDDDAHVTAALRQRC
jgi:L-seryl-tRNA(Ser) seleniumtransferase